MDALLYGNFIIKILKLSCQNWSVLGLTGLTGSYNFEVTLTRKSAVATIDMYACKLHHAVLRVGCKVLREDVGQVHIMLQHN